MENPSRMDDLVPLFSETTYDEIPSGELTFCHGKIHHAINGKIHYFYGHVQLRTVSSPEGNDVRWDKFIM